jgi:hypothetical protein
MRDVILPFVVVGLIAAAVVARRVLRPALSTFIALCAVVSVVAYASLEVFPWVRSASFFQPVRVQIQPPTSFGATSDGQPAEISVQVFRGSQLLKEERIPGLGKAVAAPTREPLRLEPLKSGNGFRVMAGKTALGELSGEALAEAGVGGDLLPDVGEPSPEPVPEVDIAASDVPPDPSATPGTAGSGPPVASGEVAPAGPRVAKVRRPARRTPPSEADRELELRARASQLSREGNNCEGERLLREQGRDERSQQLARELEARCRWKGR